MNDATYQTFHIKLFAGGRQIVGADEVAVAVPPPATIGQLRAALVNAQPALDGLVKRARFAVNCEFASDAMQVPAGAEIALIPPVSGG